MNDEPQEVLGKPARTYFQVGHAKSSVAGPIAVLLTTFLVPIPSGKRMYGQTPGLPQENQGGAGVARPQTRASNLDRYGGDIRLKSRRNNVGVTFFGKSTAVEAHSLTDRTAHFATDGRLAGKLINPNYCWPESAASPEKWFRVVANTANTIETDPADGDLTKFAHPGDPYQVTGVFALERISDRWWFIDPEGNVFFPKAVAKTDTWEAYSYIHGTFQKYDGVYLQRNDGSFTQNLSDKAEDPTPADVVNSSGVTLQAVSDAIYIGSVRPFDVSYFYLGQLGVGGKVEWYYSSREAGTPWRLVNGSGNPAAGTPRNVDESYNLDVGDYLGLDPRSGELVEHDPKANRIHWWTLDSEYQLGNPALFPRDFAPTSLPVDPVSRYYIRGVVTQAFVTQAILSQLYDTPSSADVPQIKYSSPGVNPLFNWFKSINERYRAWGWNAAGQYSHQYLMIDGNFPFDRMPTEPTVPLSTHAMEASGSWHIKNVYEGQQCPPGSGHLLWQGHTADVFEPGYKTAIEGLAASMISSNPWTLVIVPEEGDDVYGFNKETHEHMGYVIISQNPFKPIADGVPVKDPKFYSKFALRDFLRYRYKTPTDPLSPFTLNSPIPAYTYRDQPSGDELAALRILNAAWGTSYTTWETSSRNIEEGTNAWGTGTGLMDENGQGVFPGSCDRISYRDFSKPSYPQVKRDLDDFVAFFVQKYGSILYPAIKSRTANLVAITIYSPPAFVSAAISRYSDLLWTSLDSVKKAQEIYDHFRKPLIVADYLTANHDSPVDFGGPITTITYDAGRDRTIISFSGRPYKFRRAWPIEFPDIVGPGGAHTARQPWPIEVPDIASISISAPCGDLPMQPTPTKIAWNTIEIAGNYTVPGCVHVGDRVRIASRQEKLETQSDRARAIQDRILAFSSAKGTDGYHFVAGWEHWCYMDHALLDPYEYFNFGLVTALDNAYDGREARKTVARDHNGRFIGGEDDDYGDLIGPLAPFLKSLYDRLLPKTRD